jgi:hypothetical protein
MLQRRGEERTFCKTWVEIHWKNQLGQTREAIANLEDISMSGACLQLERPIPLRTVLTFTYQNTELTGTVRHCVLREVGFVLGVQFDPGCRWSARNFKVPRQVQPRARVPRLANRPQ